MLKQKSVLSFTLNILGSLTGFVSLYFVAHYMGPEPLGIISSCVAFIGLFSILGDFGFASAHIKRISEGKDIGVGMGTFITFRIITTIIMTVTCLVAFYIMQKVPGKPYLDPRYLTVFFIILFSVVLNNLFEPLRVTFQAKVQTAKESISFFIQKAVLSACKILVALMGLSVIALSSANLISVLVYIIILILLFRGTPINKPNKEMMLSYKEFALPIMFIGVIDILLQNSDKLLINYFTSAKELGYYTGAQSLTQLIYLIGGIFYGLLFPTYSAMFSENRLEDIRLLANKVERSISILLVPIVVFLCLFSNSIRLLLLGEKFSESTIIIIFLSIASMLTVFSQPYNTQITASGKVRLAVKIISIMFALDLALSLILIPSHIYSVALFGLGAKGASISILISSLVGTILFRYQAFKTTKSKTNFRLLIHLLVSLLVFSLIYLMSHIFLSHMKPIVLIFITFSFGFPLYLLVLYFIKELTKGDILFYKDLINIPKLIQYIKGEIIQ